MSMKDPSGTTPTGAMTPADFADALDRLGASLDGWPAETRHEAEALLRASAAARRMHLAAMRVDGALATLMTSDLPVSTEARRPPQASPFDLTRLAGWSAVALAASLVIGFAVGIALPPPDDGGDAAGTIFVAVQDSDMEGLL